jgi:hypothetical protein
VSVEELRKRWARRLPALLAVLTVGLIGVAWSGCGSDSNSDASNEAQERIEQGLEEAKKGVETGKQEVEKGFEKGKEEAQKGIEEGKKEAQKGIEEGERYADEYTP